MKRSTKITLTVITVIVSAVLLGFVYDALMTVSEKHSHPKKYENEISELSKEYGVPEHVIYAVIKVESNFDPSSVSDKGAYGLMQITPASYNHMTGANADGDTLAALTDAQNIEIGTKYLAWLYLQFENWDTVYAAYNAGIGRLIGTEDELGWLEDPEYSDDGKTLKYIPFAETRNYVRSVKAASDTYLRLYY